MTKELKYINNKNSALQINDLITLGLYNVLMIILMGVGVGVCAGVFSVLFAGKIYFALFTTAGTGLLAGPAFTLIFNKINKKYAVFISSVILGIFLLASGHLLIAFPVTILGGIIAEYFYRKNNEYLSYLFFTLGGLGAIIPVYFMREAYVDHLTSRNFPMEKINFIMQNSNLQMFIIIIIATVVFSFIGTYIGRKIYYKNFEKAGL